MADDVVLTSGLTKRYPNGVTAVADLDLRIRSGEVYGFLGRNGAGKTTTMRMLVGLVRPTSGSVRVLGAAPGTPEGLSAVGSLIEAPAFYPYLSGRDNLRLLARYCGRGDGVVRAVLERVGLAGRGHDRFRVYSQGMKQRLGVAAALLKDSTLLVLDEPTNGLDPSGMAGMRELVRSLAAEGRTVILSSHLLGEVEQVCDRVGVIQRGRLIAEGTTAEITAGAGAGGLVLAAEPAAEALRVLREFPGVRDAHLDGALVRVETPPGLAGELNRALVLAGVTVTELRAVRYSLEEAFLELTVDKEAEGAKR